MIAGYGKPHAPARKRDRKVELPFEQETGVRAEPVALALTSKISNLSGSPGKHHRSDRFRHGRHPTSTARSSAPLNNIGRHATAIA